MARDKSRFWKYMTPAVLCLAIGLATPLWYAVRAAGLGLLIAVGSFIYGTIAVSVDLREHQANTATTNEGALAREKEKKALLKPLRFAAAAAICAVCLLGPTVFRIVTGIGYQ